ncbi:hypothetical protein L1887_20620 [Cichorium endivia]|nr:hypothetical protein L1887_20620 [Cichorium endivia]
MKSFLITLSVLPVFFLIIISKFRSFLSKTVHRLPPGPPGLPIIGNLHQLDASNLPDHLWRLSKRYGPLMSLRLGLVQTLVVSSAEMAKEVLKTRDLVFCTRPLLTGPKKLSYNNKDVASSPYNEYWREMRKICTLHLFSLKQVNSFGLVREDEVFAMIDTIKTGISTKQEVNLNEIVIILMTNIICRVAFSKRPYGYSDEQPEARRFHELVLECSALLANFYYRDYFPMMGWLDKLNGSITRLEKNFKDMDECYQEIIDEHLNQNRPKENREDMVDILLQLKQDSDSSIEFSFDHIKGILMNILLGGAETRMSMGAVLVEVALSNLLYSFDWEVPEGTKEINTLPTAGAVSHKKDALRLVAKIYDHGCNN